MPPWLERLNIFALFSWIDQTIHNMLVWVARVLNLQDDVLRDADLLVGEELLHVTRRHWARLLLSLIVPTTLTAAVIAITVARALGVRLFQFDVTAQYQTDAVSIGLGVLLVLIGGSLLIMWLRGSKNTSAQLYLIFAGLIVGALFVFRFFLGGQFLYLGPPPAFDVITAVSIVLSLLGLYLMRYTFENWANDQIILTNRRVIVEDEVVVIPRLIERRTQDQMPIEEVQNVNARTETYLRQWFNYGTIIVTSAAVGRRLIFDNARDPGSMQAMIDKEVRKLRGQETQQNFAQMIEERVLKASSSTKPQLGQNYRNKLAGPPFLRRFLDENPKYIPESQTLIWYPHWFFVLRALLGPVGLLAFGILAILAAVQFAALAPVWVIISSLVLLIVFLGWAAWEVEDYRNDKYILTPTTVIDIDKKPFGPEDRRTASLGALQNVRYNTTFLGNLIGYGDVLLDTAGSGGSFTFLHVPNPRDVVSQINDYIKEFKKGEKERSLNDALTLLRYYHEALEKRDADRARTERLEPQG